MRRHRGLAQRAVENDGAGQHNLPPGLASVSAALEALPSDRLRYQQLMALAGKLPAMDPRLKVPAHRVPGCLSTVHVHASLAPDGTVHFTGDSDALISKGLVALLVIGLSGCTPAEIEAVKPDFIKDTGITASLTPGRNSGFLNMLKTMKRQTKNLVTQSIACGSACKCGDS